MRLRLPPVLWVNGMKTSHQESRMATRYTADCTPDYRTYSDEGLVLAALVGTRPSSEYVR